MLEFMFEGWLLSLFIAGLALITILYNLLFAGKKLDNLRRKYVLVTGCGSGFGRAIAIRLDEFGFCVIATCRTQKAVQSLRDECSDRAMVLCLDVTSSEQINNVYEATRKHLAPGEGILNNNYIRSVD